MLAVRPTNWMPGQLVLKGLGLKFHKAILAKAGIAFENNKGRLEKAGIAYKNSAGDIFDFHAIRHTAITMAGMQGVSNIQLQTFSMHKDLSQIGRYSHHGYAVQRDIVEALPSFKLNGTHIGTPEMFTVCRKVSRFGGEAGLKKNVSTDYIKKNDTVGHTVSHGVVTDKKSGRPDLNRRPPVPKTGALPS